MNFRIILNLFLFFGLLFAKENALTLKQKYYCDDDTVYASDFFPEIKEDFEVAELKNKSRIQLSSRKLKEFFLEKGIKLEISHPVVLVIKSSSYEKEPLIDELKKSFSQANKNIKIKSIKIKPKSYFEQKNLVLKNIEIPPQNLSNNKGGFSVFYSDEKNNLKRVYFSYEIIAKISVLKAKHNIPNGTILNSINTSLEEVDFKDLRAAPLDTESPSKSKTKSYIQEGSIITQAMAVEAPDIAKNDEVAMVYKEGGVVITISAKALHDAKIGETVKLKTENGKTYNAIVTDKKKAKLE